MTGLHPTEAKFESHIESCLKSAGFTSRDYSDYDRNLCLIRRDVIDFIRETQPESWNLLEQRHGVDVEKRVLKRIADEISGHGIIEVLRTKVIDLGVDIKLCYFKPKSDMASEHQEFYQQNRFILIRQLHYSNRNENSIDMALFLNGLPLITIELKNQLTGQHIRHSEYQYQNDRNPREPLLKFKRCIAHFCIDNDRASMTTKLAGKATRFLPYNKDINNPSVESGYRTSYIWSEIFVPDSLLDILENFVHISKNTDYVYSEKTNKIKSKKSESLIFPRYHQLTLLRKFKNQLKTDGAGKNYLVQHTTGSGKSYSIGWLAHALTSFYQSDGDTQRLFDTVIVVTDRKILDQQLRRTVTALERTAGVVSGVSRGAKELKKFLEGGRAIVVTTIQKFPIISENITPLNEKKFAVIIDEVHSSQSGELSKELKRTLSRRKDKNIDDEDYLIEMIKVRGRQKHISFFGFTGTPKAKTLELFGTKDGDTFVPFHIYSMRQSIHEKFTLDVLQNYTTFKRYLKLNQLVEADDQVVPTGRATRQLLNYVDSHEVTIRKKVSIMLDHWVRKGSKGIKGCARGMIVTRSRKHCVQYFHEVNQQLEQSGQDYHALVAFSGEVKHKGNSYTEHSLNRDYGHSGDIPRGLKNPKFRLLIIAEKFQTGFDEPLVQTMYVDKALRGVQCVQTLSRLNRTMPGKTEPFVLDFVNEPEYIQEAFQQYYQSTSLQGETDPNTLYDTKSEIEKLGLYNSDEVDKFFETFVDPERSEGDLHSILDLVVDGFTAIEEEEIRENFRAQVKKFISLYGYISQIITFVDVSLEKTFIFLKFLIKKLPARDPEQLDVTDAVDLDSLRIQKTHELKGKLKETDSSLAPPVFADRPVVEPDLDLLSEIIDRVNQAYSINLTEDDKISLGQLKEQLDTDDNVQLFMRGDSSDINKQEFFRKQFDEKLRGYVNDRLDFYKRMIDNRTARELICSEFYKNYQITHTSINETRI